MVACWMETNLYGTRCVVHSIYVSSLIVVVCLQIISIGKHNDAISSLRLSHIQQRNPVLYVCKQIQRFFRQVFGIRRSVLFCDELTTIYSIHYEYDRVFKYCAGEWIQSKWMNEELKRRKTKTTYIYIRIYVQRTHIESKLNKSS